MSILQLKLNKMNRNLLILFSLVILFISCEELELQTSDPNIPIIESYISPGDSIEVLIYKQFVFESSDTVIEHLNTLDVNIQIADSWFTLNNAGKGIYKGYDLDILPNAEVNLEFEYNDKLVSSSTSIPTKPEDFTKSASKIEVSSGGFPSFSDPITLSWANTESDYHLIVVEVMGDNPDLIDDDEESPLRVFRNAPTQGESQDLNARNFTYFGQHRVILFKLNPEYAALYEQLGSTSLDITTPPSNIENGLGIFTGVNSDTLYISVVSQ